MWTPKLKCWFLFKFFSRLTDFLGLAAKLEFDDQSFNHSASDLQIISLESFREKMPTVYQTENTELAQDLPTIHAVGKYNAKSKAPILIIIQNGVEFRCAKTHGNGNQYLWFNCSRRSKTVKCFFTMKVRMTITQDHENEFFWNINNWQIVKIVKQHTCHLYPGFGKKFPVRSDTVQPKKADGSDYREKKFKILSQADHYPSLPSHSSLSLTQNFPELPQLENFQEVENLPLPHNFQNP